MAWSIAASTWLASALSARTAATSQLCPLRRLASASALSAEAA
jgi:hypothetical protein